MGSVNKVIIVGNLGSDPELRYTADGRGVVTMRIATNERFTDRDGNPRERTEWHRIVVWGKQAENCNQYLSKGRQVYVEGRLQTREWEDRDGNRRFTTEVVADRVVFLSGASGERGPRTGSYSNSGPRAGGAESGGFPQQPGADGFFSEPPAGRGGAGSSQDSLPADDDVPF